MKKILVPTDFSGHAERAMSYALGIFENEAERERIEFILLHVQPAMQVMTPIGGVSSMSPQTIQDKDLKIKEKKLVAAITRYEKEYPKIKFRKTILNDSVLTTIRDFATEEKIDLIVLGSRGINTLERTILGSTSLGMAQESPCPVLIIPEDAATYRPKKVVFATDFKNLTDLHILDPLKSIASDFDSEVKLVHIYQKEDMDKEEKGVDIADIVAYFDDDDFDYYFLQDKDVVKGIEDFVSGFNADLLALVAQERGFFENLFHRSVTKSLLIHSQIPVLVLHPLFWGSDEDDEITFKEKVKRQTELWKSELDRLKVQSHLAKVEAAESLDKRKEDANKTLHNLRNRLDSAGDVAQDKWQHFQKEMSKAISHIKKAFLG